ncbi:MAG: 1-acyl-sn-glycerol-3-phosphate acyltransferase, partial [Rhodospirillales bacterium]
LYHDMGLIGAWLGSLHSATLLVIMSPLSFLARPRRWLRAIHRHGGTLSAAPNFAYELCLRRIDDKELDGLDLRSWRNALNGAEAVRPETVERFCQRFAKYGLRREAIMPVYGLAESSVGLAFPPPNRGPLIDRIRRDDFTASGGAVPVGEEDAKALRFVACGRPLPGHQMRVVDAGGRELPERQEGRLQFRGPSVTSGYFRNPQATRRLFKGDWLDSGDRAYIAGGDVYITGRAKDIIIRAGRNIHPDELEEAIGDVPGIRKGNVAVFGSADPDSGTERLVILAETRKRGATALDQLRGKLNALATDLTGGPADDLILAPPGTVLKTSSGKIRRAASRELYEKGDIGRPQRAVWWQITRLVLAATAPRLRRARSAVAAALYAAYAWTLLLLVGPFAWLLVALLPREAWRWAVIRATLGFLAWASGTPLAVRGLENLPPSGRPCVFAANHASYLDGAVMVAALPGRFSFVAKAELIERFVPRLFLSRIGTEFVERFDAHKGIADSRRLAGVVRGGRALFYFAEGTCVRTPGLLPFHMGAFAAAVDAGVPVVPITIRGTRSILRSESGYPRRGAITVVIGKPLDPRESKTADAWTASVQLRDAVRLDILRHCGEPDLGPEDSPF